MQQYTEDKKINIAITSTVKQLDFCLIVTLAGVCCSGILHFEFTKLSIITILYYYFKHLYCCI